MTRVTIEVFCAPGCRSCDRAKTALRSLVEAIGTGELDLIETDVIEQLDRAVSLGVRATPSVAVNGRLAFVGLPSIGTLRAEIAAHLSGSRTRRART